MTVLSHPTRITQAEQVLYRWACADFTAARAGDLLARLGYAVDFRQPFFHADNRIAARDLIEDRQVLLEV